MKAEDNEETELWGGGEYRCMAAYPSPPCSMQLGRQNLHLFRLKNTRFDVIGGIFYFCLVVSSCVPAALKKTMKDVSLPKDIYIVSEEQAGHMRRDMRFWQSTGVFYMLGFRGWI